MHIRNATLDDLPTMVRLLEQLFAIEDPLCQDSCPVFIS
jgi:N-acetylglutamate synthase-like GNAT family acetyltransferase